jgi:class 3 adenylate cyclase/streptogramin lyase
LGREYAVRHDRAVSEHRAATATFLFTDIEGSTALLKQLRERYAIALADHHRILRDAFAAHGGTEIDNQGDSFFVAFRRAREAVLAAADAQRALHAHEWPEDVSLRVRMGIHTGEADVAGDRYVGVSVHRAARISALGHGGQVLVSQTTEHLLEDEEDRLPGLRLRDLGQQRLKDLERPIRVYQLDIEGLPSRFAPLRASAPPARRRLKLVAAAAILVVAAAIAAFVLARGESPPEVLPNSVVRIDPNTGKPTIVIPVGRAPDLVVSAGGYVWTTHHIIREQEPYDAGDRTLTRVDPNSGEAVVVGGGLAPCGLTGDPSGDIWVANCYDAGGGTPRGNVVRVDAESLRFENTWSVPSLPASESFRGLAYGGGSLWVSGGKRFEVYELDPSTGRRKKFALATHPFWMAWADGSGVLWWSSDESTRLTRLTPATRAVDYSNAPQDSNPFAVAVAGDTVVSGDLNNPRVLRVNAVTREQLPPAELSGVSPDEAPVLSVAAAAGYIWAATPSAQSVWKIDARTNAVERIRMPYFPVGVTASGADVWVTVRAVPP